MFRFAPNAFGKNFPRQSAWFPHRINLGVKAPIPAFEGLSVTETNDGLLFFHPFAWARGFQVCHSRRRPAFHRRGAPRSPSPTHVAQPHLPERRSSRIPLRYVALAASLYSCICSYRLVAWFCSPFKCHLRNHKGECRTNERVFGKIEFRTRLSFDPLPICIAIVYQKTSRPNLVDNSVSVATRS